MPGRRAHPAGDVVDPGTDHPIEAQPGRWAVAQAGFVTFDFTNRGMVLVDVTAEERGDARSRHATPGHHGPSRQGTKSRATARACRTMATALTSSGQPAAHSRKKRSATCAPATDAR
jgi:hypothetical protein